MIKLQVVVEESDLLVVLNAVDIKGHLIIESKARALIETLIRSIRQEIQQVIEILPSFKVCLEPLDLLDVQLITNQGKMTQNIQDMITASGKVGVGPMATVAGIVSKVVADGLIEAYGPIDFLIENGGDLYIRSSKERIISVYAGESVFSNRLRFRLPPKENGYGICTSAGTVGHSLSFGKADAAIVLSDQVALADAAATQLGNLVKDTSCVESSIQQISTIEGIKGLLVIIGETFGAWGEVELVN